MHHVKFKHHSQKTVRICVFRIQKGRKVWMFNTSSQPKFLLELPLTCCMLGFNNASLQFSGTASRKAPPCVPPGPCPTRRPSWTQTRPRRSVRQIETKLTDVFNMELRSLSAGREGAGWVSNEQTCYLDCFNLLLLLRQAQCLLYCFLALLIPS